MKLETLKLIKSIKHKMCGFTKGMSGLLFKCSDDQFCLNLNLQGLTSQKLPCEWEVLHCIPGGFADTPSKQN